MGDYTTETINAQFMNQNFLDKVDAGMDKEASLAMSAFVRQRLREEGFTRKILPPTPITNADLDRDTSDEPSVVMEKEPESKAASLPFTARSNIRYFTGPRYRVPFHKIQSDEFNKSKYELMTYRTDIRTILEQNSVKDLQTQEDSNFIQSISEMASANDNALAVTGGLTVPNLMTGVRKMLSRQLPVGCILMNQSLYTELLEQPATQVGSPLASGLTSGEGTMESFFKYNIVTTIKNDLVADNEYYVFTQPNYLGQFMLLQDSTVYLESKADMIKFFCYSSLGVGIGNVNGAVKVTL